MALDNFYSRRRRRFWFMFSGAAFVKDWLLLLANGSDLLLLANGTDMLILEHR